MARIVGINLIILLLYTAALTMYSAGLSSHDGGMNLAVFSAFLVTIHSVGALIAGIVLLVMKKQEQGVAFMVTCVAVVLVGFSACLGGLALVDML